MTKLGGGLDAPSLTCSPHRPTLDLVLITPLDLATEPLHFTQSIPEGAIDYAPDTRQLGPLPVTGRADLIEENRGPQEIVEDIRIRAGYKGAFEILCARCLEPVHTPLEGDFDLLFRPEDADAIAGERAITEDETEIGYYDKSGLLLEDVVREQVLLTLPGRTLCQEDCKGLCAHCGQNLNEASCNCAQTVVDPRWNALAGLAESLKQ